jgi:hypothetical protein
MTGKNIFSMRISENSLNRITEFTESSGIQINRSDLFGAALSMLYENPNLIKDKDPEDKFSMFIECLDKRKTTDLMAIGRLIDDGRTTAYTFIDFPGLKIKIAPNTRVNSLPPHTLEFILAGDFRVQLDFTKSIRIEAIDITEKCTTSLTEKIIGNIGRKYGVKFTKTDLEY